MFRYFKEKFFKPAVVIDTTPRHYSLPAGTRVYAIGDIHGKAKQLKSMMEKIVSDAAVNPAQRTVEIYLGDYVDRGLNSREVIDLLIAPPPAGHERICLMGNHEATLLRFLRDPSCLREWGNYGGFATLQSYGVGLPPAMTPDALIKTRDALRKNMPPSHQSFYENLSYFHVLGEYLFVHAGILPGVALEDQSRETMMWTREPFLSFPGNFEHYVVHGHTPVKAPEVKANRANLDISAITPPSLACLVIEGESRRTILTQ